MSKKVFVTKRGAPKGRIFEVDTQGSIITDNNRAEVQFKFSGIDENCGDNHVYIQLGPETSEFDQGHYSQFFDEKDLDEFIDFLIYARKRLKGQA